MSDIANETKPDITTFHQEQSSTSVTLPSELLSGVEYIQNIDWKDKLDTLDTSFDYADTQLQTLVLAEEHAQISKSEIQGYLIKIIKKNAISGEKSAEIYKKKFEADPNDVVSKSLSEVNTDNADAYKSELKRIEDDPEYAHTFFTGIKESIKSAKERVRQQTKEIDQQLEQFFRVYRQEPGVSLDGRILPLTDLEYRHYMHYKYGKFGDLSLDMAQTSGQTTHPHSKEPRGAVVKLNSHIVLKDTSNPSLGIKVATESSAAEHYAAHEGVHLLTDLSHDEEVIETPDGRRIIDRRGFRERYLDESGNYVQLSKTESELPLEALDEGTVVFFERYIQFGQDINKVIESLDKPYQRLSPYYVQAAKLMTQIVQEMGITSLASNYINSKPTVFIQEMRGKLGNQRADHFMQEMRNVQKNIRN